MKAKNKKVQQEILMTKEDRIYQVVISVIVALVVILCVIPFLYVIGMSFSSEGEMIQRNYFIIIPHKPILTAYKYIIRNQNFFTGMGITIARTSIGIFTALILSFPVGYIMAIRGLPFKNTIMVYFIITMILSGGLIPTYILYRDLKLLNTFWVYIAPSFATPYGIAAGKAHSAGAGSVCGGITLEFVDGRDDLCKEQHPVAHPVHHPQHAHIHQYR